VVGVVAGNAWEKHSKLENVVTVFDQLQGGDLSTMYAQKEHENTDETSNDAPPRTRSCNFEVVLYFFLHISSLLLLCSTNPSQLRQEKKKGKKKRSFPILNGTTCKLSTTKFASNLDMANLPSRITNESGRRKEICNCVVRFHIRTVSDRGLEKEKRKGKIFHSVTRDPSVGILERNHNARLG